MIDTEILKLGSAINVVLESKASALGAFAKAKALDSFHHT
jgi:hypothetical protein